MDGDGDGDGYGHRDEKGDEERAGDEDEDRTRTETATGNKDGWMSMMIDENFSTVFKGLQLPVAIEGPHTLAEGTLLSSAA